MGVNTGGSGAALRNGPNDEALSSGHVTAHEHAGTRCRPVGPRGHVSTSVKVETQFSHDGGHLWASEAHRKEDQVCWDLSLGAGHRLKAWTGWSR